MLIDRGLVDRADLLEVQLDAIRLLQPETDVQRVDRFAAKIIEGKMEKNLYAKIPGGVLLSMPYPKEDEFKGTYGDLLKSKVAKLKENIQLRRFVRMEVGK